MTPSTATQLAILIMFVIPGLVYQAVRARLAGEAPQNRDTTNKILRALAASVVLVSVYLITLGPALLRIAGDTTAETRAWIAGHPREVGVLAFTLLFAAPALAALVAARRWRIGEAVARVRCRWLLAPGRWPASHAPGKQVNRALSWLAAQCEQRGGLRYDATPTAWDWAVDHGARSPGFVRVLGKDGSWKGGAFARGSYFTSFPEPPAIFVEAAWQLDGDGEFVAQQPGTSGAWIPCVDALVVEFLAPARNPPPDADTE
jgi:hypothetical protein